MPDEFYQNLATYLELTVDSVSTPSGGDLVNVDEEFSVTFALRNTAPTPRIRFLSPRLQVRPGQYAHLASKKDHDTIIFDKDVLEAGGAAAMATVALHAIGNIGVSLWPGGPIIPHSDSGVQLESVVEVRQVADLDWQRYGQILGNWTAYHHDIEPK